jgi:hypothetical protein
MSDSFRQLTFQEVTGLVEKLLACPSLSTPLGRANVVKLLSDNLRHAINYAPLVAAREDMTNIVNVCLNFQDGLESLVEKVRFFDKGSIPLAALELYLREKKLINKVDPSDFEEVAIPNQNNQVLQQAKEDHNTTLNQDTSTPEGSFESVLSDNKMNAGQAIRLAEFKEIAAEYFVEMQNILQELIDLFSEEEEIGSDQCQDGIDSVNLVIDLLHKLCDLLSPENKLPLIVSDLRRWCRKEDYFEQQLVKLKRLLQTFADAHDLLPNEEIRQRKRILEQFDFPMKSLVEASKLLAAIS